MILDSSPGITSSIEAAYGILTISRDEELLVGVRETVLVLRCISSFPVYSKVDDHRQEVQWQWGPNVTRKYATLCGNG